MFKIVGNGYILGQDSNFISKLLDIKITYNTMLGLVGIVLMLPALVLISGGILFSVFHFSQIANILNPELFIFHPVVIIGGLVISIGLNLSVILKMGRSRRPNLYVVLLGALLFGAIILYLIVENTEIFSFTHGPL